MKNLTYIFAATLFMVACNNEEISSLQDGKNLEVKFTSNLTDYDSQVVSRLSGASFDKGDQVAIWASSEGEAPFTGREILTAGADGKLSSTEKFTYKDDNEVSFSALYPASLCAEDSKPESITLNVEKDEKGYQSLPDLIYATATGSTADPNVSFMFKRQLAKVCVAVKNEGVDLEGAEVFVKAKSGGVFNLTDVAVTVPADAQVQDYKIPLVPVTDFNQNTNYGSTIVAPQTLEGECIGIKLKDQETKYVSFPSIVLDRAKKYIFNITTKKINEGDVEISIATEISEEPWISDEVTVGEVEVDEIPVESNLCLVLSNTKAATDVWGAQVWYELEEPLKLNVEYTYSFMAKADSQYKMEIYLQSTQSGNQQYFPSINISNEWQEQSLSFTPRHDDEASYDDIDKLTFNFGTYVGKIYIDNVKLVKSGTSENILINGDFEEGNVNEWKAWDSALFSISASGEGYNQ